MAIARIGLIAAAAVGIAAGALWWRAAGQGPRGVADRGGASVGRPAPGRAATRSEAQERISRLAGRDDPAALGELIDLYGKLASSPDALDARKLAFRALVANPTPALALAAALNAIALDQTPRQQDPMWPELVAGVASLWNTATIEHGRDRLALEERPKPRDVLLESLAAVSPDKLSNSQRADLAADLIDLYPRLKPEQKPAVEKALAALGSSDLIEILGRRGLAEDSHLKAAIEERRAQEAARAALPVPRGTE
jgi:hypothetical protein